MTRYQYNRFRLHYKPLTMAIITAALFSSGCVNLNKKFSLLPNQDLNIEKYNLRKYQSELIFKESIKPKYFPNLKEDKIPIAVVILAPAGSGKSTLSQNISKRRYGNIPFLLIDGDDLRHYHPKNNQVIDTKQITKDVYSWKSNLLRESITQRINIITTTTFNQFERERDLLRKLRLSGYKIDLYALAVKPRIIEHSIIERHELEKQKFGFGRMVSINESSSQFNNFPNILNKLYEQNVADTLILYRRNGDMIYENELQNGEWKYSVSPNEIYKTERDRTMTVQEKYEDCARIDRIISLQNLPSSGQVSSYQRKVLAERQLHCRQTPIAVKE